MKRIIRNFLLSIAGKKKYQNLFEDLHQISLKGMNIGGGSAPAHSGEIYALQYIYDQLKESSSVTIFDVGANVGKYSNLLKDTFGNKAQIFSFEPSKKTFQKLLLNTNNINSYNFGFGYENQKLTLFSNADESGLASLYKRKLDHFNIQMDRTEEVEIKTIDKFCIQNDINHIHFLKLDIEGHELKALEGAKKLVSSGNIDYIQFEFGGCNIDSKSYFRDFFYLLKDNYTIFRIVKDGLFKIDDYKERYETFSTTNFLAERVGFPKIGH